jgi:PAS domain S-box-containing protein
LRQSYRCSRANGLDYSQRIGERVSTEKLLSGEPFRFLRGDSDLAALIRDFDWAGTALGPIESWTPSLRAIVAMIINSQVPMVLLWGDRGHMIYNDAYSRFAGGRHPQLLGSEVRKGWPEVADFNDHILNVGLSGGTLAYRDQELTLFRMGIPEQVWMNLDYSPVIDESGEPAGVIAIVMETTQRVLSDRRNEMQHRRLAEMFEQGPSFMALLEGPDHRFEFANASYLRLIGGRDLIGKTVAEALPDAATQGYVHKLDAVFASGKSFSSVGSRYLMEVVPGGEVDERYIDFVYQPLKDSAGNVTGIFVEGVDVTEQKRADAALKQLNETLEQRIEERTAQLVSKEALITTFYNHSSEYHAVIAETDDGRFRYDEANPALLRMYGKTRAELIGHMVDEVFKPETAAELTAHLRACLAAGTPYRYERQNGDAIVEAVATPVPEANGKTRRLVVSARDITEHRHLEQQLRQSQKMEAVGQLTGGLAHDFNNLLTGVTGSLELMEKRFEQRRLNDIDRYLHAAKGAAKRAAALTHRLLAFSRRQTLDPKPTDVNSLVSDMEELIRRTIGPHITFEFVGAIGLWRTLTDPHQLENALLNLCINARDAMPHGGRLTVETCNRWIDERGARTRDLAAGQYISLCVTDNGTGMSAEVISRAFDPFFTTKPLGEGTGLGLSMVYGFARQSGGQTRIYSEVGKGTMVCLYLPRCAEPNQETVKEGEIAELEHTVLGETVLVVDDEQTVRMLITDVLEELGYTAIDAGDGKAGLQILESKRQIDLLITDVGLPGGMNGRQLADAGTTLRPDLKVLFITGYAENAVIGDGHLKPGMHVLTKPFGIDALANRITSILNSRGSQQR